MKEFPIPVVAVGPGSQPEEEDLQYVPLPSSMMTFALPVINEEADPALMAAACEVVELLRDKMDAMPLESSMTPVIELLDMEPEVVRLLNQTMGEGEVSISVRGSSAYRIQETVFAGVWRLHEFAADGRLTRDAIMACAIPPMVTQWAQEDVSLDCQIPEKTPGIMNALSVLTEIVGKAKDVQSGRCGACRQPDFAADVAGRYGMPPADIGCGCRHHPVARIWQLPHHQHQVAECVVGAIFQQHGHADPEYPRSQRCAGSGASVQGRLRGQHRAPG